MADNLAKMEARIRELEAQRAKGKDVPELDALYAKMDAANRKGADEASKTVTGETPPVKKAKGGDVKVKKMALGGIGSRPTPAPAKPMPPQVGSRPPPPPGGPNARPPAQPVMPPAHLKGMFGDTISKPYVMRPGDKLGTAKPSPPMSSAMPLLNKAFMKKGGAVKSASSRGDGIAQRGKTKGRMV